MLSLNLHVSEQWRPRQVAAHPSADNPPVRTSHGLVSRQSEEIGLHRTNKVLVSNDSPNAPHVVVSAGLAAAALQHAHQKHEISIPSASCVSSRSLIKLPIAALML